LNKTQVIEIRDRQLVHFDGSYEEYLASQNIVARAANS